MVVAAGGHPVLNQGMNDFKLAQAIHTIAIAIGGLAFVATVPMPLFRRTAALEEF